jgi:hypothetical protein
MVDVQPGVNYRLSHKTIITIQYIVMEGSRVLPLVTKLLSEVLSRKTSDLVRSSRGYRLTSDLVSGHPEGIGGYRPV